MIESDCRVLTWNVWWRFGEWQKREPLVVDAAVAATPDLVALQEAWMVTAGSQASRLAAATGLEHVAWSRNRSSERWRRRLDDPPDDLDVGLAVVSRWPIRDIREVEFSGARGGSGGRTALGLIVDHPRGPLPFVTTHLEAHPARSSTRVRQLNEVANLAADLVASAGERGLAPVVCGDMNAEPESDEIRRFGGLQTEPFIDDFGFQDAWHIGGTPGDPGHTWCRENPWVSPGSASARIDYVFCGLAGRVARAELVGIGDEGMWPSDHAGVVADLRP